jgi:DNA-directed RNA polymerase specialized sigma24 family protein
MQSYSVKEVARLLGLCPQAVYSLIERGRLEAFNAASDLTKRACLRVTEKALVKFQSNRAS